MELGGAACMEERGGREEEGRGRHGEIGEYGKEE